MQDNNKPVRKNSQARINANNKYKKAHYHRIAIDIKPAEAEYIRATAKQKNISLAQLIVRAVTEYDINHTDNTAESRAEKAESTESTESTTTEDTAEQIPEYIKNMIDRSKAYDKDFSEKQRAKRKVERERAKAEYNSID